MAAHDNIPDAVQQAIADEVGKRLANLDPELQGKQLVLGETFVIWSLVSEAFQKMASESKGVSAVCQPTGRWLHQIKRGNDAIGFARSVATQPNDERRSIEDVTLTPVSQRINDAIEWTDEHVQIDISDARLLSVPTFYTSALWLITAGQEGNLFVVADAPSRFHDLRGNRVLTEASLQRALTAAWVHDFGPEAAPSKQPVKMAALAGMDGTPLQVLKSLMSTAAFKRMSRSDSVQKAEGGFEVYATKRIKEVIGTSGTRHLPVRMVCLSDNKAETEFSYISASWYHPHDELYDHPSDYKVYLKGLPHFARNFIQPDGLFIVAKLPDESYSFVIPRRNSTIEGELYELLGSPVRHSVRRFRPSSASALHILAAIGL